MFSVEVKHVEVAAYTAQQSLKENNLCYTEGKWNSVALIGKIIGKKRERKREGPSFWLWKQALGIVSEMNAITLRLSEYEPKQFKQRKRNDLKIWHDNKLYLYFWFVFVFFFKKKKIWTWNLLYAGMHCIISEFELCLFFFSRKSSQVSNIFNRKSRRSKYLRYAQKNKRWRTPPSRMPLK